MFRSGACVTAEWDCDEPSCHRPCSRVGAQGFVQCSQGPDAHINGCTGRRQIGCAWMPARADSSTGPPSLAAQDVDNLGCGGPCGRVLLGAPVEEMLHHRGRICWQLQALPSLQRSMQPQHLTISQEAQRKGC